MIFTVKVTTGGRFTIPKKLRELFGWNHGDELMFSVLKPGEISVRKHELQKHRR